jgi:hypothetical protein
MGEFDFYLKWETLLYVHEISEGIVLIESKLISMRKFLFRLNLNHAYRAFEYTTILIEQLMLSMIIFRA